MTKHWTVLVTASLATLLAIFAPTPLARADIFQWEYINPANPSLGKQQSTVLTPDGAGVNAVPGSNLSSRNLTMAYLIGADLSADNYYHYPSDLTGTNLSQADLTNAKLTDATLTGAVLTGAEVRGANFGRFQSGYGGSISLAQLYSTASYQAHDLSGIGLRGRNFGGANLAGQNLTNADFREAYLTATNLTGAQVRGAEFSGSGLSLAQLYSTASYQAHDLTGIGLNEQYLTGANLAGQNLTNAGFRIAQLTGADFTGAQVQGANFGAGCCGGTGLTTAQLSSTASYQAHDLTGIKLSYNNLSGGDFSGQNLTNADLNRADLTGANLAGADVRGANFTRDFIYDHGGLSPAQLYATASYQAHDLTGIGLNGNALTGANLAGQNLTNASFENATLTGANFTGARVRGADFENPYGGSINLAQLYSTASYQAHDLTGIGLDSHHDLTGANLAGQNLANASFYNSRLTNADLSRADLTSVNFRFAALTNANFSQANLANANFAGNTHPIYDEDGNYLGEGINPGAYLTNANLSGADARGASFQYAVLDGANTTNLIESDGHIAGLELTAGASLVVRDYDGNLPIVVDQHLAMDATGTLRLVFDADPWDSTISFTPGIPVALGGTLELAFAPGVDVATQSGRTIDLFDWTGVTPTGGFTISSPCTWNLTNLYTTGEVTLAAAPSLPGDFNNDGTVDAADYVVWRKTDSGNSQGYTDWQANFGEAMGAGGGSEGPLPSQTGVPEPATLVPLMFTAAGWCLRRGRAA